MDNQDQKRTITREALTAAYQIVEMVKNPKRLERFKSGCFGLGPIATIVHDYAQRSLVQNLRNAMLLRDEERSAQTFEKVESYLARCEETLDKPLRKADKTRAFKGITAADYNDIMGVVRLFKSPYSPDATGTFELSEILSGVMCFNITRNTLRERDFHPKFQPIFDWLMTQPESYFSGGYPYDVFCHDVVAFNGHSESIKFWWGKEGYCSSSLAIHHDDKEALSKECYQGNGYSVCFAVGARTFRQAA